VKRALDEYQRGWLEQGNPWDDWMNVVNESTALFARLIRAGRSEVGPTFSASSGASTLMSCLDFKDRNKIVVTDLDFPATTTVMLAQARRGAEIHTIESRKGCVSLDDFDRAIDDRTALVVVVHASSLNGFKLDPRPIAQLAHEHGALVLVDAYQTAGNSVVDVKRMDADFLVAGTQKYLLGIPGSAFLYSREEHIPMLEPTSTGWFSQKDPFMFGRRKIEYAGDANRFQIGTWSVSSFYAARAGIKLILEVGDDRIQEVVSNLTSHMLRRLPDYRFEALNAFEERERGALVSIRSRDAHEAETQLRKRRIIASARGPGLRFAYHFFNTEGDVDSGLRGLTHVTKTVGPLSSKA
jgi:selenocysteine lyase/cysteine desulfurase